jgi:hypothetical protein
MLQNLKCVQTLFPYYTICCHVLFVTIYVFLEDCKNNPDCVLSGFKKTDKIRIRAEHYQALVIRAIPQAG